MRYIHVAFVRFKKGQTLKMFEFDTFNKLIEFSQMYHFTSFDIDVFDKELNIFIDSPYPNKQDKNKFY